MERRTGNPSNLIAKAFDCKVSGMEKGMGEKRVKQGRVMISEAIGEWEDDRRCRRRIMIVNHMILFNSKCSYYMLKIMLKLFRISSLYLLGEIYIKTFFLMMRTSCK